MGLLSKIKSAFLNKYLASLTRGMFKVFSGVLLGIGLAPELVNQFSTSGQEVLIALIVFAIGQGWSWADK